MPGPDLFTTFSFTYSNIPPTKYVFEFVYFPPPALLPFTINAYINGALVGTNSNLFDSNGTIDVLESESSYANYFTQGTTISAYLECVEESNVSANIYGIFQRQTNSNNIYITTNPKFVYTITTSANTKSIILPPITQYPFTQFYIKYLNADGALFSLCPYMCNVAYPITTTQFVSTTGGSSNFSVFFDSQFNNSYASVGFSTGNLGYSITCMNNTSNWFYTNQYTNSLTITAATSPITGFIDSNRQILFYEYSAESNNIELASNSFGYPKYISVRNSTADNRTILLLSPAGTSVDNVPPVDAGQVGISFLLTSNTMKTVGVFYDKPQSRYIVLSDYDGTRITPTEVKEETKLITTSVAALPNFQNTALQFIVPQQQLGYAMINTICAPSSNPPPENPISITVSVQKELGYSIYYSGGQSESVSLSNNQGKDFSYTFATFYQSTTSNSISIPIYKYLGS